MDNNKIPAEKKKKIISAIIFGLIIAIVLGIGIYEVVIKYMEEKAVKESLDTSVYAEMAASENAFQYSDSVIEINSKVFAADSSKITVRDVGGNDETTLVTGNFVPGIVTDSKTVYYYDLDTNTIKAYDVKSKKSKDIVKVLDNIKPDEKTTLTEYTFQRFDGAYKNYLYYQVSEGDDYMPNYMVDVTTGKVTKLSLSQYGTYKFQIADGKLYFDMFRTMNTPTVLYTSNPDGSDIKTLVEGITAFEVIGEKIYYLKIEDYTKPVNKIMYYDIKTGKHTVVKENIEYTSGGFTSYGMVYDKMIGNSLNTVIEYYDGGGEALNGNGAKICGEVVIIHAGVPEDVNSQEALTQARVPEWFVVGKHNSTDVIRLPENTTPVNFKDGYMYYYTYSEDGKAIINRTKVVN